MVRKVELNLPIRDFTRHLKMECFESAVPANFASYALTFFDVIFVRVTRKFCDLSSVEQTHPR